MNPPSPSPPRFLLAFFAGLLVLLGAHGTAAPVTLLGAHGPISNRIAVVYIGDGFDSTVLDRERYVTTVERNRSYRDTATVAQPYKRYKNFFNYYRVDLVSPESGIDEPEMTPALVRNTPLDGIGRNSTRLGEVSNGKTCAEVSAALAPLGFGPTCAQLSSTTYRATTKVWIYVALNSTGYYNSGGPLCVFSRNYWGEIALHEGGHSHHQLADEYTGTNSLPANEPGEINVTKDPTGALKWGQWLGYNQPGAGVIGAYEGARYVTTGMYRPDNNSKMNQTSQGSPRRYNIVSMEKIVLDIYARVRPLDGFRDTAGVQMNAESLWVKTVDTSVLKVDWYVDSVLIAADGGEGFRLPDTLPPGPHTVRAHVYDEIVRHSGSANASPHPLDWVRRDLNRLQQDVRWRVSVAPGTALRGGRPARAPTGLARVAHGRLTFDLPWAGAYRLRVYAQNGKLLAVQRGRGARGPQSVPVAGARSWPDGPVVIRLERGGSSFER